MTIGIDASRANSPQRTGTEWYSYYLIEELKRVGIGHTFVLYSKEKLQPDFSELPRNFHSRILPWPPRFLWTQFRLSSEMLRHPPDVLFVPAHTLPVVSRAKMVVTVHDVGFCAYPELYSVSERLYHRFSVWFASRFAYKIICPSEFTKSELIKYYHTNPQKVAVIPHGIRTPDGLREFSPSPDKYLLYVGRLEQKKNILGLLQAFAQTAAKHPGLKLVLAGRPGYGFEAVKRFITENNLQNSVVVTGYITIEQRAALYAGASVFVFPTLYEGFGLPILEAQSYGCPVITSNFGAAAEVAGQSAFLVNPRQSAEVAAAINKLLGDEIYRRALISKGYENVKKYSWRACAEETLKVLTS